MFRFPAELGTFSGEKILFLVSDDCPVSQVAPIIKARQLADQRKNIPVIIAPLQKLSLKHLSMAQMVSGANMFFIDDEKWRQKNLAEKIKLPFSVLLKGLSFFAGLPGHGMFCLYLTLASAQAV